MRQEKPIIVALDVTRAKAEQLVDSLVKYVSIFKIGHQLFLREGVDIVHMVQDKGGKVFLDLKFHDIPSVISNAIEVAAREKVHMLTMHTLGGKDMLEQASDRVKSLQKDNIQTPLLLGVTILTSLNEQDLHNMGISLSMQEEIAKLAEICKDSALDGIVCSGKEVKLIRKQLGEDFLIITPGVMTEALGPDDQKRTVTVEEALKDGADYLVMGRSITTAEEPKKKMELILQELNKL
jgi:orotidine-5'-phosphate decarboxylase